MQKPDKTKQHQQCSVARYQLRVRRPPQALFRQGSMTQGRIYYRLILQVFMLCGTPYFCRVEHIGKSNQMFFIYSRVWNKRAGTFINLLTFFQGAWTLFQTKDLNFLGKGILFGWNKNYMLQKLLFLSIKEQDWRPFSPSWRIRNRLR